MRQKVDAGRESIALPQPPNDMGECDPRRVSPEHSDGVARTGGRKVADGRECLHPEEPAVDQDAHEPQSVERARSESSNPRGPPQRGTTSGATWQVCNDLIVGAPSPGVVQRDRRRTCPPASEPPARPEQRRAKSDGACRDHWCSASFEFSSFRQAPSSFASSLLMAKFSPARMVKPSSLRFIGTKDPPRHPGLMTLKAASTWVA